MLVVTLFVTCNSLMVNKTLILLLDIISYYFVIAYNILYFLLYTRFAHNLLVSNDFFNLARSEAEPDTR
jgi:hypothetical protein